MEYPTIDLDQFKSIMKVLEKAANDPEYLDPSVCPYDETTREQLVKAVNWVHPVARATVVDGEKNPVGRPRKDPVLPIEVVETEVDEIRKEIAQLKADAKGLETADRIQIIKTRAALVEKIIGMKERITGLKQQRQFIVEVIAIMEDILEQSQRDEVIKRLQPFLEE